jgi:hypothetical protein
MNDDDGNSSDDCIMILWWDDDVNANWLTADIPPSQKGNARNDATTKILGCGFSRAEEIQWNVNYLWLFVRGMIWDPPSIVQLNESAWRQPGRWKWTVEAHRHLCTVLCIAVQMISVESIFGKTTVACCADDFIAKFYSACVVQWNIC